MIWDLVAFYMGHMLIGSNFFSLLKLVLWFGLIYTYSKIIFSLCSSFIALVFIAISLNFDLLDFAQNLYLINAKKKWFSYIIGQIRRENIYFIHSIQFPVKIKKNLVNRIKTKVKRLIKTKSPTKVWRHLPAYNRRNKLVLTIKLIKN